VDEEMTASALGLHQKLTKQNGANYVGTDEYWKAIDTTMRRRFPEYYGDGEEVPTEPTKSTSANFTMTGEEGATFRCSVDGAHYKACASPFTVNRLAAGNHTLRVTQADESGADSAATTVNWTVSELDAPTVAGKVGLKVNFSTRVTTLNLAASADQADQPNPVKWIEYFSHPTRPAASARQNPKKIRQYGTTVVLPAKEVAFWVRVKDTKGKWSGWYSTKK
jgi:hypothetical protein